MSIPIDGKKMFLLFSHQLIEEQKLEAIKTYGITKFISLPKELQYKWSNISPDIDSIEEISKQFKIFLKEKMTKNDIVLVQGDFGMVYSVVNFCKENNLIPVYATTKRIAKEYKENNETVKKSIFKFRRFREYE